MRKIITTALLLALSGMTGCMAYAHPPRHNNPADNAQVHNVRAWVWVDGHWAQHNAWVQGYWEVQLVPRYLLSRHPRTHVRWVQGRARPNRPHRRHRRSGGRRR